MTRRKDPAKSPTRRPPPPRARRPRRRQPRPDFIQLSANKDWAEYGDLEGVFAQEDDLEPFLPEGAEDDWRDLGLGEEGED